MSRDQAPLTSEEYKKAIDTINAVAVSTEKYEWNLERLQNRREKLLLQAIIGYWKSIALKDDFLYSIRLNYSSYEYDCGMLNENLTSELLKLDGVISNGNEDIRKQRKDQVQRILFLQEAVTRLHEKAVALSMFYRSCVAQPRYQALLSQSAESPEVEVPMSPQPPEEPVQETPTEDLPKPSLQKQPSLQRSKSVHVIPVMSPEEFAKARQQASQTSETKENLSPEEEARRKRNRAKKERKMRRRQEKMEEEKRKEEEEKRKQLEEEEQRKMEEERRREEEERRMEEQRKEEERKREEEERKMEEERKREEERKMEEEKRREEEERKMEEEKRREEEERKMEEERKREEEQRRMEEEKKKQMEEEKRRKKEERQRAAEARRRKEEEERKRVLTEKERLAAEARQKAEEARLQAEKAQKEAEEARLQAEEASRKAEQMEEESSESDSESESETSSRMEEEPKPEVEEASEEIKGDYNPKYQWLRKGNQLNLILVDVHFDKSSLRCVTKPGNPPKLILQGYRFVREERPMGYYGLFYGSRPSIKYVPFTTVIALPDVKVDLSQTPQAMYYDDENVMQITYTVLPEEQQTAPQRPRRQWYDEEERPYQRRPMYRYSPYDSYDDPYRRSYPSRFSPFFGGNFW